MDLTGMSLSELAELQRALAAVQKAGEALDKAGLAPLISLTGWRGTIMFPPLWSAHDAPVVMIEDQDAQHGVFPDGGQDLSAIQPGLSGRAVRAAETGVGVQAPSPAAPAAESGVAPAAEEQAPAPVSAGAVEAPLSAPHGDRGGEGAQALVTGPLSEAERAAIRAGFAAGRPAGEVAAELRRKVQVVAMAYTALKHPAEKPAAPVPVPVEPVTEAVPVAPFEPVAAVAARVVEGVAALRRGECPADITGTERRIWQALEAVGYRDGFDAELDLEMVWHFTRGAKADRVALELDMDSAAVVTRYRAITACIRDDRDRIQIDLQPKLVSVLRRRAADADAGGLNLGAA